MKKFILMALAITLFAGLGFSQQVKKHLIFVLNERTDKFGEQVKINDFVYIIEDSTMYCSKVALGPNATGTYLLASAARYNVANMAVVAGVVTASSGTFSTTLGVTGATTLAGALSAAGAVGFGTLYNKFTVAAATGNTSIAGTLGVTGLFTSGADGTDGKLLIYSEQVGTDYSVSLNPNAAMTSAANFYLPADEPAATYPLTVTSGGVMGYNDQAVATTSGVTFNSMASTTSMAVTGIFLADSSMYYGDDYTDVWKVWGYQQVGIPHSRWMLQNIADISIQNKTGGTQVLVIQRDTSQAAATVNLKAIHSIDGDAWVAGTSAFSTTLTRVAISIPGATASDIYAVSAVSADAFTRPGAGEQLNYFAKTDSLVVMRQTGTTSGLGVSYIRIK